MVYYKYLTKPKLLQIAHIDNYPVEVTLYINSNNDETRKETELNSLILTMWKFKLYLYP